jgi:acid phosphatase type 7
MVFRCFYGLIFTIFFSQSFLFSQKVIRGPYLQQPTTNSMVVRWQTDSQIPSTILYKKIAESQFKTVKVDAPNTDHIVKINNLDPKSLYEYQIVNGNTVLLDNKELFFRTVPKADSKTALNIWAGGDFGDLSNQIYLANQTQVRDSYVKYSKGFNTDIWLWLGDAGYGGNRDATLQTTIFDFYKPILSNVPFAAALGNHEFDEDPVNQQKTRDVHLLKITSPPTQAESGGIASGTKAYYSFDQGNTHFVNLDSYGMDDGKYPLYDTLSTQYKWLNQDLAANKSLWTIVFFHHPPYTKRGHDSDSEEELRLLRQTLVPIFDKYNVDLVLNGHSHIYERSFLIKNHLGSSDTFDPKTHIVNYSPSLNNSGSYKTNEPPYINKTNGTVYVVNGTFGRLEPILVTRLGQPQHPTSFIADLLTGGSLAIKIEDNRLDLEWLCADGIIRDRFTMLKNVNKMNMVTLNYGEKTILKASWIGNYKWDSGKGNTREVTVNPLITTIYNVTDSLGFLKDQFQVNVAKPVIETNLSLNQIICNGKTINGNINLSNTTFDKWKFKIQLSDANGLFEKPVIDQNLTTMEFKLALPENIPSGNGYKLRVLPNSTDFQVISSNSFKIFEEAKGQFLNEPQIPFSQEITLKLNFTGSFPIEYKISSQEIKSTNTADIELKLNHISGKNYLLETVTNVCGKGKINNGIITVISPLSTELEAIGIKIYPNPVQSEMVIFNSNKANTFVKISNSNSQKLIEQPLVIGENKLNMKALAEGVYFVEINNKNKKLVSKILKK